MTPITPDLQQNIFVTFYLTIAHNYVAIFYFLGLIIVTMWAFYKPSRPLILAIAGFALLLFIFEYNKHLAIEFKNQTYNALITEKQHYKAERIINFFFNTVLPICTPILGWLLLICACIMGIKNKVIAKK